MADKNGGKINFQVGFSVDKSGLSQMQSLFQQIANKAAEPGSELKTGLQQAAKTASTLNNILTKTFNTELGSLNVTKFNQELSKSGLSLRSIKADLSQAGNQGVTAFNRLSQAILGTNQQIKQSNKALDQMFTTFKNTIRYGISSSIFNNMANSIQKAFDYSKQLDTSLNNIRIVTDKSAESMTKFAQQANEAAKGMGASTLDYTNAALIYYQQGLSDSEVQARAETTIKAANVTGQTGEEVSEQLTAVWNGYKVSAEETELYVDKLAAVAATTAADLEELSVGMSKVASAANAMGVDFDDLNAQIATIVSVTRQAPESVGTALKTIYARMGDLSVEGGVDEFGVSLGKVSEQMQMMGIEILDQNGNLRDMTTIMAEVAKKWDTWTEAQKQAAAVAMAGKRQYNNLIALFDNWDMYTDALNTSTEAMGTLQEQQDIYMESTAAKLKTLKAAWQGLYDDAINEDEINGGIEALTNLVEVFDNFISSFGGGLKSVAGFGAILSSVFNRQISESIVAANQRLDTFKNNLILAQQKNEAMSLGTGGELTADASAKDLAIEANSKVQLDYAKQIYEARAGLNQEQAKSLINLQKEIGKLEEEAVLLEKNAQNTKLNEEVVKSLGLDHLTLYDTLSMEADELFEIESAYDKQISKQTNLVNNLQRQAVIIDEIDSNEIDRQTIVEALERVQRNINSKYQDALGLKIESVRTEQNHLKATSDVVKWIDKQVASEKKRLAILKQEQEEIRNGDITQNNINSKRESQNNKRQEADAMLESARSASILTQNIMTVTSALGNMAMAWSSVNSLMDTWNNDNIEFGDKILQTFMTLGMTIPMIYSNFKKLGEVFDATTGIIETFNLLSERNNALTIANSLGLDLKVKSVKNLTKAELEDLMVSELVLKHNIKYNGELTVEQKKHLLNIFAKEKETLATWKLKTAQDGLNTSILKFPGTWILAALVAIIGGISFGIKKYEEYVQTIIDGNNSIIESSNKIQEETNANQDLYNSYEKLISQYEDNKIEKEALYDTTDKLIDKYNIESGYLAKLTGDYTEFTKAVRAARIEELKRAKEASEKESKAAKQNILPSGQQTKQGRRLGDTYQVLFDYGFVRQDVDKQAENILKRFVDNAYSSQSGSLVSEVDANDPQAIIKQYEQISQAVEKMKDTMSDADRSGSEVFQNAQKYVEEMAPTIEEYKTALSELDEYNVQLLLAENNLEGIKSFEEYNEKINSIREQLTEEFKGDSNKVNSLLNTYLSSIDNEFVKISHGLELLKDEINLSEEDFEKLLNWSDEDKKLLLSGQIEFDGLKTEEELKRALQAAKNNLSEDDLTIVTSLRAKVTSDKKLSKKEIEEAQGESSMLSQDYATEMADFDNQSQLNQLETLNKIVDDKIEINKKYITNAKETAKEDKANLEDRKNNWEEERKALEANKKLHEQGVIGVDFSEEDSDRLKELQNNLIDVEEEIANLDEIAENGLPFEDLDQLNFDNLISGIDGVISKADLLKDLAEKVGENWTIAASDIENFTRNFPEILAAQENYNILQDGSVQLTKAGQVELQKVLGLKQAELEQSNEAYQQELQKQADLQLATAEYYQNQADQLKEYLSGHQSAAQTEMNLKQNTFDFTQRLSELTGLDNEKLTNVIEENYKKAADSNEQNAQAIYDNYVALGNIAVAASQAFLTGQFNPTPRPSGSGSSGTAASSFTASTRDVSSGDYLKDLEESEIQDMIDSAEAAAQKARDRAGEYLTKKLSSQTSTKAASKAMEGAMSGAGGKESKSKSGGGSKDKQKKEEELKQLDEEFDRYWEIHKALEQIDRDLKKIDREQEHLNGPELIASLEEENKLLEQQKERYEQLYQAQQAEAAELRGQLSGMGVAFDESSGAILNYAEAVAAALATYNAAVAAFNAGPQDEAAQKSLEAAEKAYENFKKLMERYDTLYYTEMQDTQEKMEDIWRKEMENKLKAWKTKVDLELDKNKLEQQWDEFMLKAKKDFKKVWDMQGTKEDSAYQVRTGERAKENVMNTIKRQHEVEADMDRMKAGGQSELGFQSIGEARDALKELDETMRENGDTVYEAYQNAWKNYLDGIDQVADALEMVNSEFERQNEILDYNRQIIELLYGDEAYDLMAKYYQGQYQANINNIASLVKQRDTWREQLENVGLINKKTGKLTIDYKNLTEDQKKLYDHWRDAQSQIYDLTVETVKLLQDEYANEIDKILKKQTDQVKKQREEWEMIKKRSEGYYDSIESTYQIQKLASKYDQSIADAKSLKAQEKLKKLQEEEIDRLRKLKNENKELSEYEIQYANAKYEAALREIALEEAQNNKTSMKLTRDEQGNWSYQYIAEEEDVAAKRQELYDAYNELYQLASDAYEKNLETMISLEEEYYEKLRDIAITYRDDKKTMEEEMAKLYKDYYGEDGLITRTAKKNTEIRQDLETATATLLINLYDQDQTAVESMTTNEKKLVTELAKSNIKDYSDIEKQVNDSNTNISKLSKKVLKDAREDWSSSAQKIINKWNKDNGSSVRAQVEKAYDKIMEANENYKTELDNLEVTADTKFGEDGIKGDIDAASEATTGLLEETERLCDDGSSYIDTLREYVNELEGAWREVCSAIEDAIDLLREYLSLVGEVESAGSYSAGIADYSAPEPATVTSTTSSSSGSNDTKGSGLTGDKENITPTHIIGGTTGKPLGIVTDKSYEQVKKDIEKKYDDHDVWGTKGTGNRDNNIYIDNLDTGGYTGSWNNGSDENNGRLAFLHQRELVLNTDDTKNFLAGVNTIRDMVASNGSIEAAVLRAAANMANSLNGMTTPGTIYSGGNTNNSNENVFNITAEFPNANSVDEIREAILSLPNLASQYIHSNLK